MTEMYPTETLNPDEDNGTMPASKGALEGALVGRRIAKVQKWDELSDEERLKETCVYSPPDLVITLDNGDRVVLVDASDCCAHTDLKEFLLNADKIDHVITSVETSEQYQKWHVLADFAQVLELTVAWDAGNAFYYSYGFDIYVVPAGQSKMEYGHAVGAVSSCE